MRVFAVYRSFYFGLILFLSHVLVNAQDIQVQKLINFNAVFEYQTLWNSDGSILISGQNENGQILFDEVNKSGMSNWTIKIPAHFRLLEINSHPIEDKYCLLIRDTTSNSQHVEYWEIERSNPNYRKVVQIDCDPGFAVSSGIILFPSKSNVEVIMLDAEAQSFIWFQITDSSEVQFVNRFTSPYPERSIEYLGPAGFLFY